MDTILSLAIVIFLVGSIPTGPIFGLLRGKDVAGTGSKSTGATNTGRALGWEWGVLTGIIDIFKGYICFMVACLPLLPSNDRILLLSYVGILGHCFSPWLKFKGGKGVATAFGIMLCFSPYIAAGSVLTFAVVLVLSKWVSLSSCCAALSLVPLTLLACPDDHTVVPAIALLTAFIILKHWENIGRIFSGNEPRILQRKAV